MEHPRTSHQGRLKAASLLESVLALGLLAGVLSMAACMQFHLLDGDRSGVRLKAWALVEQELARSVPSAPPAADGAWEVRTAVEQMGRGYRKVLFICEKEGEVVLERTVILPAP
ncbi:MAG TPA: hypothetical protein VGE21_05890 [Flavobacteriales bacterium]